jgi:c(7)-type cytochrome triheme protein
MKALESKQVTPKPGLTADVKDEDPTDMDVELASSGEGTKAVFPHKAHTSWMGCPACHTSIFEMEKGKAKMTMAGMGEGNWCGACHGKVALPELTTCGSCHPGMR